LTESLPYFGSSGNGKIGLKIGHFIPISGIIWAKKRMFLEKGLYF